MPENKVVKQAGYIINETKIEQYNNNTESWEPFKPEQPGDINVLSPADSRGSTFRMNGFIITDPKLEQYNTNTEQWEPFKPVKDSDIAVKQPSGDVFTTYRLNEIVINTTEIEEYDSVSGWGAFTPEEGGEIVNKVNDVKVINEFVDLTKIGETVIIEGDYLGELKIWVRKKITGYKQHGVDDTIALRIKHGVEKYITGLTALWECGAPRTTDSIIIFENNSINVKEYTNGKDTHDGAHACETYFHNVHNFEIVKIEIEQ